MTLQPGIWTLGCVTVTLCRDLRGATWCKCHITISCSGNNRLSGREPGIGPHVTMATLPCPGTPGSSVFLLIGCNNADDLLAQGHVTVRPFNPSKTVPTMRFYFHCPVDRLICINQPSVPVSSCTFCGGPRCGVICCAFSLSVAVEKI